METLSLLARLSKDVRLTSRELSREEARGLVDMYYKLQHQRIALAGQIRAINQGADEPETTNVLSFFNRRLKRWKIKSGRRWANTRKSSLPGVGRKVLSASGR
jgi:hypothetical protein